MGLVVDLYSWTKSDAAAPITGNHTYSAVPMATSDTLLAHTMVT